MDLLILKKTWHCVLMEGGGVATFHNNSITTATFSNMRPKECCLHRILLQSIIHLAVNALYDATYNAKQHVIWE